MFALWGVLAQGAAFEILEKQIKSSDF